MTTSERSTVLAVFADRDRADKAIDDLRQAGLRYNQIRLAERGAGSFLDSFKSLFTGQENVSTNTPDDLMKLGAPEQEANYYQSQLDAGRAIVIVNAGGQPEQALTILHQSGAYEISARLRTAEASAPAGAPQPTAATPQPTADRPGAYNPNAPQGTYNPNEAPETPRVSPGTPRQG